MTVVFHLLRSSAWLLTSDLGDIGQRTCAYGSGLGRRGRNHRKFLKIKADLEMEVLHAAKAHKMLGSVSTNIKHGQHRDAQKGQFRLQTAPVAFRLQFIRAVGA